MVEEENFAAYYQYQGSMTVTRMLRIIEKISEHKKIVGADICGDGSTTLNCKKPLKRFLITQNEKGHDKNDFKKELNVIMNESVNLQIINLFNSKMNE